MKRKVLINRRTLLKGISLAPLATPFITRRAMAAQTVNILGAPGLHLVTWKEISRAVAEETKGELNVSYDPLGYAPAYTKLKSEAETNNHQTDIFYADAPYPERAFLEGLTDRMPYDNMPATQALYSFARREYALEIFHTEWGVISYNTKFVKPSAFKSPSSWEEFTDAKWKGKVSWVDPRSFPTWVPIIAHLYGDKWIDYCKRLDQNVNAYQPRWIDNRQAVQRGDAAITFQAMETVYIGSEVDKAPVAGVPIIQPKPAMGVLPVSAALVKKAPNKEAAVKLLDMISKPKFTKILMDVGLNPSNNPANFPHPMPEKILEVNSAGAVGIKTWDDLTSNLIPINWMDWAGAKMSEHLAQWEAEVLKARK